LQELSVSRVKIAKGVLRLLEVLLPLHETKAEFEHIRVLNRFQLDSSSPACVLNLVLKFFQSYSDTILLDSLLRILVITTQLPPLALELDLTTSVAT
jgi:hypothetical protein